LKGGEKIKKESTTQDWLPFDKILDNGIIVTKETYVKVLKILPINYNLKSKLEKESILNSYKLFLRTCNFNIQILIQSKKESLSKMFLILDENSKKESNKIKELANSYKEYINEKNNEITSSSKNYYLIINQEIIKDSKNNEAEVNEKIAENKLNEKYYKVKEALSRCGNIVYEVNEREETINILRSFIKSETI